jgi:hypothetical protein
MGRTVKGIYDNGTIRRLEDPQITGTQEVGSVAIFRVRPM